MHESTPDDPMPAAIELITASLGGRVIATTAPAPTWPVEEPPTDLRHPLPA
ncbi:hypothetical protein [Actinokineospora sp. HUAS TT18]|uniref:hypothetical protein n=1 Tax=Actinokineospora sp. HUAS TT18 TaxID=3447451 RepID=UPI003F51EA47